MGPAELRKAHELATQQPSLGARSALVEGHQLEKETEPFAFELEDVGETLRHRRGEVAFAVADELQVVGRTQVENARELTIRHFRPRVLPIREPPLEEDPVVAEVEDVGLGWRRTHSQRTLSSR